MASKDEYKSEYSEELTNFIKTPSVLLLLLRAPSLVYAALL